MSHTYCSYFIHILKVFTVQLNLNFKNACVCNGIHTTQAAKNLVSALEFDDVSIAHGE